MLFDAEGVVIDTEKLWDQSQEILLARRRLPYHRAELKPLMAGKSIAEGAVEIKKFYHLDEPDEVLALERRTLITDRLENDVRFLPGFMNFFEQLDRPRIRTAVATALDSDLLELVDRRLGLRYLFEDKVYSIADVNGRSKPDPAIFLYAATQLGASPASCLVIEDAPHGIAAAKRAGMTCWALASTFRRERLAEADQVFESFEHMARHWQNESGRAPGCFK